MCRLSVDVCLSKLMDPLEVENSVCWYHHMLKIQDGYMLRRCINCMLRVKGCGGDQSGHGGGG